MDSPIRYSLLMLEHEEHLKRLSWAKNYKNWTAANWRKVLFSDESHFEVQSLRITHMRWSDGESVSPKHMQQTTKYLLKRCSGSEEVLSDNKITYLE
jgi:hypothetical protein